MNDVEICVMHDNDLDKCVQVIRSAFKTVAKEFGLTETNSPTNAAFMKSERLIYDRSKGNLMYVLKEQDIIAGFMQLENKGEDRYELKNICVAPEYRHRGFGEALLHFAKGKVQELGGNKISIGIIEENTVLKQWYSNNGFIHLGTKKFDHLPFTVGFMEAVIE
jgi:ribosomal protein S18 acetylase RimI-like enzyme